MNFIHKQVLTYVNDLADTENGVKSAYVVSLIYGILVVIASVGIIRAMMFMFAFYVAYFWGKIRVSLRNEPDATSIDKITTDEWLPEAAGLLAPVFAIVMMFG